MKTTEQLINEYCKRKKIEPYKLGIYFIMFDLLELTKAETLKAVHNQFNDAWFLLQNSKNWRVAKERKERHLLNIEQREDELCLVYANIFDCSVDDAKDKIKELKDK